MIHFVNIAASPLTKKATSDRPLNTQNITITTSQKSNQRSPTQPQTSRSPLHKNQPAIAPSTTQKSRSPLQKNQTAIAPSTPKSRSPLHKKSNSDRPSKPKITITSPQKTNSDRPINTKNFLFIKIFTDFG